MWLENYISTLISSVDANEAQRFLVGQGEAIARPVGEEQESALTMLTLALLCNSAITVKMAKKGIKSYMDALDELEIRSEPIINPECKSCVLLPLGQAVIAYYNSLKALASSTVARDSPSNQATQLKFLKASALAHALVSSGAKPELVDARTGNISRLGIPFYWKSEMDLECGQGKRKICNIS